MYFFRCKKRETLLEVEPHLITENTFCTYSCSVLFYNSIVSDML